MFDTYGVVDCIIWCLLADKGYPVHSTSGAARSPRPSH